MKNTNTQIIIAGMALIAAIIAVGIYLATVRVDQYLKIKAINECGQISRFQKEIPDEGITVYYPEANIYKSCLDDKGVK